MANVHRGDVDLALASGPLTLRLTLGALAEVEQAFGVADLTALGERLKAGRLSARDLILILGAAARGGGNRLSDAEFAARVTAADLHACIAALADLFRLTFGDET